MFDTEELLVLLAEYIEKHPLALECGGEYIYDNDKAQEDAVELVSNIFDLLMEQIDAQIFKRLLDKDSLLLYN